MNDVTAIENLHEKVDNINKKVILLTKEDRAGRTFLVVGIVLMILGLMGLNYVFEQDYNLFVFYILGFLLTEAFFTGFALMHKSLRGAWL